MSAFDYDKTHSKHYAHANEILRTVTTANNKPDLCILLSLFKHNMPFQLCIHHILSTWFSIDCLCWSLFIYLVNIFPTLRKVAYLWYGKSRCSVSSVHTAMWYCHQWSGQSIEVIWLHSLGYDWGLAFSHWLNFQ